MAAPRSRLSWRGGFSGGFQRSADSRQPHWKPSYTDRADPVNGRISRQCSAIFAHDEGSETVFERRRSTVRKHRRCADFGAIPVDILGASMAAEVGRGPIEFDERLDIR